MSARPPQHVEGHHRGAVPVRRAAVLVALAVSLFVIGCSADDSSEPTGPSGTSSTLSGSIIVSAAASLTDSFTTIRDDFLRDHPDADVTINFGSSGALSTQIQEGAPADVATFADTTPMTALEDDDLLAGAPKIFAENQLIIVTTPGNPAGITSLADLATAGVISLCVDTAPCGKFADQILADAGVMIPSGSVSRGTDVRATITAVTEGDAEAAIVYVTDATAAGERVATVEIPDAGNVTARYPIAVVDSTANAGLAAAFQTYVLSDRGQAVLGDAGFSAP